MIALEVSCTPSYWDTHSGYLLKMTLFFPNLTHCTYHSSRIPQMPPHPPTTVPQDLLKHITVTITRLFPADAPHLPLFPGLLMSSRTATGWHLLKLCSHCDLSHTEMVKNLFSARQGAPVSFHSFPNYQLCLSSPRLHFAAAVALLPFSLQTNFERLSKTVDRKCHWVCAGSSPALITRSLIFL